MMRASIRAACVAVFSSWLALASSAFAQISDGVVKIGVLSNQTPVGADASGAAAASAARFAVEDFGGTVHGAPIEVIDSDFGERPDLAAETARRWFEKEKVDVIVDIPVSSAALAVQEIVRNLKKTLLVGGAVTSNLTGSVCSPFTTHWTDDSYALDSAVVRGVSKSEGDSWFFVAVEGGRVLYDLTMYQVKSPAESKYPWDYYTAVRTVPAEDVFSPTKRGRLFSRTIALMTYPVRRG